MLRLLLELLGLYLLYKLIFDFIIPLVNTTKQVKKQFGDMHTQMKDKMADINAQQQTQTKTNHSDAYQPKKDDYIEFEEIK